MDDIEKEDKCQNKHSYRKELPFCSSIANIYLLNFSMSGAGKTNDSNDALITVYIHEHSSYST